MRAYSCADGTGGGKKGDPGEGKGDEEDSLLMVTVSEGVESFVSGLIRAEVMSGIGWKERQLQVVIMIIADGHLPSLESSRLFHSFAR